MNPTNGMTRKQFFKLLVALMYFASSGDFTGFRRLLPRKWKTVSLDEINVTTREYLDSHALLDNLFVKSPLIYRLRSKGYSPMNGGKWDGWDE